MDYRQMRAASHTWSTSDIWWLQHNPSHITFKKAGRAIRRFLNQH